MVTFCDCQSCSVGIEAGCGQASEENAIAEHERTRCAGLVVVIDG